MVFCKYVAVFTSDGFIHMSEGNLPALQSPSVLAFPVLLRFVWESVCGASERAAQSPAPLRQGLTSEPCKQAGGQGSLLSDYCFLLALIDQRQRPPTVCHISAKWITDKSVGAHCSTDLTTCSAAK